jgi:hypothetical protein
MALIRGAQCLSPCPRCLILSDQQGDYSVILVPRTVAETRATLLEARGERYATGKEEILKAVGLRDVDVRFNSYYYYIALSSTILHAERVLEDRKLGSVRRTVFRSAPYFPWRLVS